jgi:hypothetical protein
MPRFYLDSRDGDRFLPDEEGTDLASLHEARQAALASLGEIAKDVLQTGDNVRDLLVIVRSDDGHDLLTVSLVLRVQVAGGEADPLGPELPLEDWELEGSG